MHLMELLEVEISARIPAILVEVNRNKAILYFDKLLANIVEQMVAKARFLADLIEMAEKAIKSRGIGIALASKTFGLSEI